MLDAVTPNQEELSLCLKRRGAFPPTDEWLFNFEVTNPQSGFFGTLPGNDSTLKKKFLAVLSILVENLSLSEWKMETRPSGR